MPIILEKWYPALGGLAGALIWYAVGLPFPKNPDPLLGAAATVASVFASFLGVSKAIILSIRDSEIFRKIESAGYKDQLFSYLLWAIHSSITFAAWSILGFFIEEKSSFWGVGIVNFYHCIWVGVSIWSLLSYVRISSILFKMLRQV